MLRAKKLFRIILVLSCFVECVAQTPKTLKIKCSYIILKKTACLGQCPVYEAKIEENGFINITVDTNFVLGPGRYFKQVSVNEVKVLFDAFEKGNFFKFKNGYMEGAPDFPIIYVTYYRKGGKRLKTIKYRQIAPVEIKNLAALVENFLRNLEEWFKIE